MPQDATTDYVRRGRDAAEASRWTEAYVLLTAADEVDRLGAEDLERLAMAAHLTGRHDPAVRALERTHHAFLADGSVPRAVRAAFWLTMNLMEHGDTARGGGWFATARRLLDEYDGDCVERGYLCLAVGLQCLGSGDPEAARAPFEEARAVGERFQDRDLLALARLGAGQVLVAQRRIAEGAALHDEVMISVTGGQLSDLVAGIVYCAVIEACRATFDVARAVEWTAALSEWCDIHPDVLTFRGQCLTYRCEVLRIRGDWSEAAEEARRARDLLAGPPAHPALGALAYQEAELLRLRGAFTAAEDAYREASRWGRHPEPGLALLRLAQGRVSLADAAIRRALNETADSSTRARLLPAYVEIVLAAGDSEAARTAAGELVRVAEEMDVPLLRAAAAQAQGLVLLASAQAAEALPLLRRAWSAWQALGAPYEASCTRVAIARACEELGDTDSAQLERDGARSTFRSLGAAPALSSLDAGARSRGQGGGGLTPRELEVLGLVERGRSNRDIAAELVISEKTVARHMSNILAKAEVHSRTAAVAFARERGLL